MPILAGLLIEDSVKCLGVCWSKNATVEDQISKPHALFFADGQLGAFLSQLESPLIWEPFWIQGGACSHVWLIVLVPQWLPTIETKIFSGWSGQENPICLSRTTANNILFVLKWPSMGDAAATVPSFPLLHKVCSNIKGTSNLSKEEFKT